MTGDLVADLGARVAADVVSALGEHRSCALIDFPRHLNVGDSAIWAGERALLRRTGIEVVASADKFAYSPGKIRRAIGDRPLCIHGGGNFGDLYRSHHELRERIMVDFADRPIVQMPQSINFQDPAALERTKGIIADHGRITLLLRDRRSFEFAQRHFDATSVLTCDAAFGIGRMSRPVAPEVPVVHQTRTDKELAAGVAVEPGTFDWLGRPSDASQARELRTLEHRLVLGAGARGRAVPGVPPRWALRAYDGYTAWNIARGTRMLARGASVVTDRLHGHILCVLMGIPHVVVNDRYGKIQDFWDTWTSACPYARLAGSRDAADMLLAEVAPAP